MVTKASTMPMIPTMTLTVWVKASPACSWEVWISTSAMVLAREGIAHHVLQGGEHNMPERPQVRRGLRHVGDLDDRHAGRMRRPHAIFGVLQGQTRPGIGAQKGR